MAEQKATRIPVVRHVVPQNTTVIVPIGDVHIGDPAARIEEFQRLLEKVQKNENWYILLVGDILNNAIKSSVSNVYNESMPPSEQKKFAVELLRPVASKILGMVSGNHEHRTAREVDQDVSLDIALALGIENRYCPEHLLVDIRVGRANFVFYLYHGHTATRYPGGTVNAHERIGLNLFGADFYVHGHAHRTYAIPYATYFYATNTGKVHKKVWYDISVPPWSEWSGYAVRKQLRPQPIVPILIELFSPKMFRIMLGRE